MKELHGQRRYQFCCLLAWLLLFTSLGGGCTLHDAEKVSLLQILVYSRNSKHIVSGAIEVRFARRVAQTCCRWALGFCSMIDDACKQYGVRQVGGEVSHPKSGMWPARGKHTPMPLKPWPTSYLFKIRHDLAHSGRLPTCKWHKPQAVIYHMTCTPSIYINNYIFIHIISQYIQHYRLFTEYLYDI